MMDEVGGLSYKEWPGKASLRRKRLGRGLGEVRRRLGRAVWGTGKPKALNWECRGLCRGQQVGQGAGTRK